MITINVARQADYVQFILTGHANFAEKGRDIVCAAVSILSAMLENVAAEHGGGVQDTGEMLHVHMPLNHDREIEYDLVMRGYELIAAEYPDYVKINYL